MKKFRLIIEKVEQGYWGRIKNDRSLITSYGGTIPLLKINMKEAIELTYEEKSKQLPDYEFELVVDVQEFFEINNFINISTLAEYIGMNPSLLRQYAKGIKFPSIKQVSRIEKGIKEIGKQLMQTELQPN